jgi:rhodanese-related sulfurtransferase
MRRKAALIVLAGFLILNHTVWLHGQVRSPEMKHDGLSVPMEKQTILGLYVSSKEAYAMWQKSPEDIKILDCRTPEEYVFVGHAPMANNIPLRIMSHNWDPKKNNYVMSDNPNFISEIKKRFKVTDTILVMCRFGGRSAVSVNKLAEAGFKRVYNIIDGFEGDPINDSESYFDGKHMKNGWKNSGAPWTYQLDPRLIYHPPQEKALTTKSAE